MDFKTINLQFIYQSFSFRFNVCNPQTKWSVPLGKGTFCNLQPTPGNKLPLCKSIMRNKIGLLIEQDFIPFLPCFNIGNTNLNGHFKNHSIPPESFRSLSLLHMFKLEVF